MHIPPYDNENRPIIDVNDPNVPLTYFNIVKLKQGENFAHEAAGYETCIAPAHGTLDVVVKDSDGKEATFAPIGERGTIWENDPSAVYVPVGSKAEFTCRSGDAEVFIGGARFDERYEPFAVRPADIDIVQYGSDETKTHRKIKHILGKNPPGRVGRLLVSELFTVGAGGWSGFPPHKHEEDRLPDETRHDEVYNFRFRPEHGFGLQLLEPSDGGPAQAFQIVNGSTVTIRNGYHPCVAAPGYEMYYFTVLGGLSQRPLIQFFHPTHAYQIETIPGIKDMIAKFR